MESKIPDWMGNLCLKPDKKEPVKIDSNDSGETAIYRGAIVRRPLVVSMYV